MSVVGQRPVSEAVDGSVPGEDGDRRSASARETAVALVVVLAFVPFLMLLARYLWSRPHYQFFPLILVGFVLLVRSRWTENEPSAEARHDRLSSLLLQSGLVSLAGAVAVYSPWLAGVAALLTAAGMLLHFGGPGAFRRFIGPWCLLWLIVPLPFQLDSRLIEWLQATTSHVASLALDRMGIRHLMEGNILEFPGHRMLVEEACSGIHSLYALAACVGLFVVWARRPELHSILLVGSALVWSGLTNAGRVVAVAVAMARYDVDLATGWPHEALSIAVFTVSLLMAASTDQLLLLLGRPVGMATDWLVEARKSRARRRQLERSDRDDDELTRSTDHDEAGDRVIAAAPTSTMRSPTRPARIWSSSLVAIVFGCLGLLQILTFISQAAANHPLTLGAEQVNEHSLPAEHNGWKRAAFEVTHRDATDFFGEVSKAWTYESPICNVAVSFDYPFNGWHELTRCYRSHGWNVVSRRSTDNSIEFGQSVETSFVEAELSKPSGEHGYLLFGVLNSSGDPLQPPQTTTSFTSKLREKIAGGPLARLFGSSTLVDYGLDLNTYQFQTFAASTSRLSENDRTIIQNQFRSLGRILREELKLAEK